MVTHREREARQQAADAASEAHALAAAQREAWAVAMIERLVARHLAYRMRR